MSKKSLARSLKRNLLAVLKNPFTYVLVAFIAIMIVLIDIVWRYEAGVTMNNYGDSVWNFLIAFVAGYYDICVVTPIGRLCSFIILLSGILLFSTLTGKIASIFMEMQMKKNKGLKRMKNLKGHFLLCGYREGFERILDTVLRSNPDITPDMIVLINDTASENIEQIRNQARFKDLQYVSGDFSEAETLNRALIKDAERVLIISDRSKNFSRMEMDSRTVLAVLTMKNLNPKLYIAAELYDSKFQSHLEMAHCDEIILTSEYEHSLLATASSGMGYSNVIRELIGEDADSGILIEDIPSSYIGRTYAELRSFFATGSVLIGLLQNTGNFYMRRQDALREAQKNPDVKKIVGNLKKIKTLKSNDPLLVPADDFVIQPHTKAIFVKGKKTVSSEQLAVSN
ncbi:NAD-binding protein [uncultured Treponema sp.]|uniref:TrkA-related ion transporter n=1 Tax=uncultured Treponema sp. TaxID=162155 RepID=UPI0025CF97B7|nr:NAD-binding protein [uncultured Treponema sp.]